MKRFLNTVSRVKRAPIVSWGFKSGTTLLAGATLFPLSYSEMSRTQELPKPKKVDVVSDAAKIDALINNPPIAGSSVAIIVGPATFATTKHLFSDIEDIPTFSDNTYSNLQSEISGGEIGSVYNSLDPIHKAGLSIVCVPSYGPDRPAQAAYKPKIFKGTEHSYIAMNVKSSTTKGGDHFIGVSMMDNLANVLRFTNPRMGTSIVLINNTPFSEEELVDQILVTALRSDSKAITLERMRDLGLIKSQPHIVHPPVRQDIRYTR